MQVVLYSLQGATLHSFDLSRQPALQQLSIAAASPVSEAFVVGSFNTLHTFSRSESQSWSMGDDIYVRMLESS